MSEQGMAGKVMRARRARDYWKAKYEAVAKVMQFFPHIEREHRLAIERREERNRFHELQKTQPLLIEKIKLLERQIERLKATRNHCTRCNALLTGGPYRLEPDGWCCNHCAPV